MDWIADDNTDTPSIIAWQVVLIDNTMLTTENDLIDIVREFGTMLHSIERLD